MPAGFVVAGRQAQQLFLEFEAPFPGFLPEARDYTVQIQVGVGHRKGWRPLLTFPLRATNIVHPDRCTVYNNGLLELTKEDRQKADAALLEFLHEQDKDDSAQGETRRRDSSNDEGSAGRDP
ncbi:hypothetical protein [Streptomyces sp. NPDC047079]|uniref:hypothetical protein n=1 Tax=Streptomyces sp. NPDC047079 TaxID=3154607 RepID=UPI0033C3C6D8